MRVTSRVAIFLQKSKHQQNPLEKQKLNFSRSALFHRKTRVSLKYFVNDCSSHTIALSKCTPFFQKNADIAKIKGALVLIGIFSETRYLCVLMCQISSFQRSSKSFIQHQVREQFYSPLPPRYPTSNQIPKKPTQIRVK